MSIELVADAAAVVGPTMSGVYLGAGACLCACLCLSGTYLVIANPALNQSKPEDKTTARPLGVGLMCIGCTLLLCALLRYVLTKRSKALAMVAGATNTARFISSAIRRPAAATDSAVRLFGGAAQRSGTTNTAARLVSDALRRRK